MKKLLSLLFLSAFTSISFGQGYSLPTTVHSRNILRSPNAVETRGFINAMPKVDSIAQLVAFPISTNGVFALGYYTPGDGGGGIFFSTNSIASTNLGTKLASTATAGWSWERPKSDRYNVKWFGAKGDATTDDTAALLSAAGAASSSSTNKSSAVLQFPEGTFLCASNLVLGATGARYYTPIVEGAAPYLSTIRWTGATNTGVIQFLNGQFATVKDITVGDDSSTRAAYGVWFRAENDRSAINLRSDNLHIHSTHIGMVIGGGSTPGDTTLYNGQHNAGLHTGSYMDGVYRAVYITGANTEVQSFIGFNWSLYDVSQPAIQTFNGRGIYLKNGEVDFVNGGNCYLLLAEGLNNWGGGYTFEDLRLEDAWGLISIAGNSSLLQVSAPAIITARNVVNQTTASGSPVSPCDMITMAYAGVLHMDSVTWTHPNSRIYLPNMQADRFVSVMLDNCLFENTTAVTDLTALVHATSAAPLGAGGGFDVRTRGVYDTAAGTPFQATARIPDQHIRRSSQNINDGITNPGSAVTEVNTTNIVITGNVAMHDLTVTNKARIGTTYNTARLEIGGSTTLIPGVRNVATTADNKAVQVETYSTDAGTSFLEFNKYRGDTNTQVIVNNQDVFGGILFRGYDGSVLREGARIWARAATATGAGDMPGELVFSTTSDGASASTIRWLIKDYGYLLPETDAATDIGLLSKRVRNLWLSAGISSGYVASGINIAVATTHSTVALTATGLTATLPTAVNATGRTYTIVLNAVGTGTVATTSSQTIGEIGATGTTYPLTSTIIAGAYNIVTVQSDNSNWIVVGH